MTNEETSYGLLNHAFACNSLTTAKRVLRKEGERYDSRHIVSTVKYDGAIVLAVRFSKGAEDPTSQRAHAS
jgi:hypothetical protein